MTFYLYHDIVFVSYYLFKDHVTVNYSPAKLEAEPRSHYITYIYTNMIDCKLL